MPVAQVTRDRLGYVRYPHDTEGECFYCGDKPEKLYNDYVPPQDVAKDAELRAMVTVPFYHVTSCHQCKSALYIHRYLLRTPEERRLHLQAKGSKKRMANSDIRRQLAEEPLKAWEGWSQDSIGQRKRIELDESLLPAEVLAAKHKFIEQKVEPSAESLPVSGPQGDAQSAPGGEIDLGF